MGLRTDHIPIILNQSSNIYHTYKSHTNPFSHFSFIFHVESITTHPSQIHEYRTVPHANTMSKVIISYLISNTYLTHHIQSMKQPYM